MEFVTPELIIWVLNGLAILFLIFGFLHGYIRGAHKSVYRLVVSLLVILGCWMLFPLVTPKLMEFDFGFITDLGSNGYKITSINDGLEYYTKLLLGIVKEENGQIIEVVTDVVAQETMLYGLMQGLVDMLLRVVLIVLVLVLNWTVFRFIFWIIYLFIKPKKIDRFGNKRHKTKKQRLIGGLVGALNTVFIFLIICIPLSGVFSIADNAADLLEETKGDQIVEISLGTEVITVSDNITNIDPKNLKPWTTIYRKTVGGFLFGLNVGDDTELDCAIFDKLFSFKAADEKIAIRKEIDVVSDSVMVIKEDIIDPIMGGEGNVSDALDNLSSTNVRDMFTELGNLKIVNIVVPIGLDTAIIYVKNNEELVKEYANLVDVLETVDPSQIVISDTIVQIGEVSASLLELVEKSGYKLSELLEPAEGGAPANYLDILLKVDTEAVTNVFDAIGNISIIDTIQEITFASLEDYMDESSELEKFILLYPHITVSSDGYYEISGNKTQVKEIADKDINNLLISLDENENWVIEGIPTNINGSENLFKIQLNDIKITDEIKNIGALYSAFKDLGISSFSEITAFIEGGPDADGSLDLSKFTYEKIDGLFEALLNFKIINKHTDNIYVILNNFLPNEYHEMLKVSELESKDLTSLVYAAKVVAETGVLWDMEEKINTNGELDYTKLYNIFVDVKDELAEGICGSGIIVDNINAVADYAVKTFLPDVTLDFSCIDWNTDGEEELKKLFNVVSVALKHGNKLMNDFYSLTDDELDEICDAFADNISKSVLLKNNMNNLIDLVSNIEAFKEMGLVLDKLDEWTEEELRSIFDSVKVIVKVMSHTEGETEKNLLVEILKLKQEDIDTFLNSEFIVKTLAHNLVEMSKEGGMLYEVIVVNLDKDSPEWYDVYENNVRVKNGELRTILTNAIKLIDGIEDFENTDLLIEKLVRNIASLSNNFGSENDEIGDLLSSHIITDTIIYYLENLDTKLSEELSEIIVISDNINWKDTQTEEGELRKLLAVFKDILIDKDGNVIIKDLQDGDSNKIIELVVDLDDEKFDTILSSKIILDTIVKFIEDFSKPSEDSSFKIYLKDKERTDDYWRSELKSVIKGLKLVIIDENGNFIELGNDTKQYIDILTKINDEDIDTLTASEILVDTLAHLIIELADAEDSFFVVSDKFRAEDWTDSQTTLWKAEIKKIITTAKVLLVDENGNSVYEDLIGNDTNKQLQILTNIKEEKYDDLVASEIITDTIAKILTDIGEDGTITISDKVKAFTTNEWQKEIKAIISSAKKILVDGEGNIDLDNITSNINTLITNVVNLNSNPNGENDELGMVLGSQIICDTIIEQIKLQGKENGGMLVVSDSIVWEDTITNGEITETGELRAIFESISTLFKGEEIDLENLEVNDMIDKITNLNSNPNGENDEVGAILGSKVIVDTIVDLLKDQSTENGGMLVISESIVWEDTKVNGEITETGELRAIFKSISTLFKDEEIDLENLEVNDMIDKITNLNSNPNGDNDEVGAILGSKVISDTIVDLLKDQSTENGGMLVVSESIVWEDTKVNGEITETGELRAIFKSISTLFKDEEIDLENLEVNDMIDKITNLNSNPNGENDEVGAILGSKVISDTIVDLLKDQSTENGGMLTVSESIVWEDTISNGEITETGELRAIFKSISTLFKDEEIDLENLEVNDMIDKITNLNSNPNGENDEVGAILGSKVISDTIVDLLKDQSTENGGMLTVSESIVWEDTKVNGEITETGELRAIFKSISTLFKDEEIDLENINVDDLINDVKALNNNPNGDNDEVGAVLGSKVIRDTIVDLLKDQSTENGGMLTVSESIVWEDTKVNGEITKTGELRNIFSAISIMYKDSNINFESINVDEILNKAKALNNNPNGANDEVGKLLSSRVIGDTAIAEIVKLGENGTLTVNYSKDDSRWYDVVSNNVITSEGELRNIFSVIPVIFTDNVDMNSINANIILDLSDSDVDKVLESVVFSDTIETKLYELDGQSDIVVNEITDLNKEVKAIIKAAKIILDDGNGNVDLDNPSFDVEKAINLSNEEQDIVLSSQIIVDTISEKLISMSEDESSMLVVNTNNISNWKDEIKSILGSIKMILSPDGQGKYLSNPQVDYEKIYSLSEQDITKLLSSDIITDTLTIALVDTEALATDKLVDEITNTYPNYELLSKHDKNVVITNSVIWRDTPSENGEVHKLLTAAQVLIEDEEVNINKLKTITDDEIDTVFKSQIILDTFYNEIDKLSTGTDPVLFIKAGTNKDEIEAKRFVKSIKVVLGDSDITNMDSSEFNFDKFTSLSDQQIETLTASSIIKYSAAKKVYPILDSGELSTYVVVKGNNENEKLDTISDDLDNLLMMVRDMNQKHDISYDSFSFEAFLSAIEAAGDEDAKNAKADAIADTLLISNIMKDSVDTMMHTVLEGTLDGEMLSAINLDMNHESIGGRNEWLDYDANSNGNIEESEIGEFKKIFRLLAHIDQFTNDDASQNSNITNKDEIAKPLKAVNNSKVLCGIIPMFVNKATDNVSTWKYNEGDALYKETLTKEEWDEEIDVISTIIALVNNSPIADLSSMNVNDEAFELDSLKQLLKEIAKSRILDISNIEGFVQDGVNDAFFDGDDKVNVTSVYTGNVYSEKVDAWNHESTGEIDSLISSIEKLRKVTGTSLTDKSAAPTNTLGYIYMGEMNAYNMGQFLDSAKESVMLSSVITTIVYEMIGESISESDIQSTNFTNLFVLTAKVLTGRFPF